MKYKIGDRIRFEKPIQKSNTEVVVYKAVGTIKEIHNQCYVVERPSSTQTMLVLESSIIELLSENRLFYRMDNNDQIVYKFPSEVEGLDCYHEIPELHRVIESF